MVKYLCVPGGSVLDAGESVLDAGLGCSLAVAMAKKTKSISQAAIVFANRSAGSFAGSTPKPLVPLLGSPLLGHTLAPVKKCGFDPVVLVAGSNKLSQLEQYGTVVSSRVHSFGASVQAGLQAMGQFSGMVLLVSCDLPLLTEYTLQQLVETKAQAGAALALLTTRVDNGSGFSCVLRDVDGQVLGCHRWRTSQTGPAEAALSVMLCDARVLAQVLGPMAKRFRGKTQEEALVTQVAESHGVVTCACDAPDGVSINDHADLAFASAQLRQRINGEHMRAGVTLEDPATTYIEPSVVLGADVVVGANVHLKGETVVGDGVVIEPNVYIEDSTIEKQARIRCFSHFEDCKVGRAAIVGPYARLRPLADIGPEAHIGNFVEVKKSTVEAGAKANHFAYLGDARVGSKANVGAGTICCNYDGVSKNHTDIGTGVFIGSNSTLVAPIEIEDGAYVAAGSTLTMHVPADALAFGRARQSNKEKLASKLRKRMLARAGKSK